MAPPMKYSQWTHGAYIRARRKALGLSQNALARRAGITPSMINRLETGYRRGRPRVLSAVATALQLPVADLLERAGYVAEASHWRERSADVTSSGSAGSTPLLPYWPAERSVE